MFKAYVDIYPKTLYAERHGKWPQRNHVVIATERVTAHDGYARFRVELGSVHDLYSGTLPPSEILSRVHITISTRDKQLVEATAIQLAHNLEHWIPLPSERALRVSAMWHQPRPEWWEELAELDMPSGFFVLVLFFDYYPIAKPEVL